MKELELAVLKKRIPDHGLEPGDVGTIVCVHNDGEAYEVEFLTRGGRTIAVVTLSNEEIRPIETDEITHVRHVAP